MPAVIAALLGAVAFTSLGAGLQYTLALDVTAEGTLSGSVTISGTALADWSEIVVRLYPVMWAQDALTPKTLLLNGEERTWTVLEPTVVAMPADLASGQTFSLTVTYSGRVPELGSGYGIFARSGQAMVLAQAYPMLAPWDGGWLAPPALPWGDALVAEAADYRAEISAPLGWRVVASGTEEELAPGLWRIAGENLRELGIVLVRGYEVQTAAYQGVVVRSFYPPELPGAGRAALQVTLEALAAYEPLGPCPFPELDLVAVPLQKVAGVEYPGLILAGTAYYERYQRDPFFFSMIFAHELAHQWWYAEVGSDQVREPWVDEALATYTSGLYFAEVGLFSQLLVYWERGYSWARGTNRRAAVASPLWDFPVGEGYGGIVYSGGALWFHEVRARMGEEAFFGALRRYRGEFRWRIAKGADVLRILRETSPVPLEDLIARLFTAG